MVSTREYVERRMDQSELLRAAGVAEGQIFAADTMESPNTFPFIVLRWGDEQPGLGHVRRRPFDAWIYDEAGDYRRCNVIAHALRQEFADFLPVKVDGGHLIDIRGGLVGGDLADDTFKAVVLAQAWEAVGGGV